MFPTSTLLLKIEKTLIVSMYAMRGSRTAGIHFLLICTGVFGHPAVSKRFLLFLVDDYHYLAQVAKRCGARDLISIGTTAAGSS